MSSPRALCPEHAMAGITLVIPAYNEAAAIGAVVDKATQVLKACVERFEIIVVDDGSQDQTGSKAELAGARVITHPYNRGYGVSLKSGISAAKNDHIIFCDADESYPLEQIPLLLADADKYDMIVGARQGKHFFGSFFKRIGRWLQLALVRFTVGIAVPDANSGFRLIKRSLAMRYFDFVCSGFSFTTSLTIALLCEQYLVKFVKVDYHQRCGRSHVRYVRDTLRSLQIVLHCILRYNPIKAFLFLSLFAFFPMVACLGLSVVKPQFLFGAGLFLGVFLVIFSMGMLAYCITNGRGAFPVDRGVDSRADLPRGDDQESGPPVKGRRAA